MSVHLTHAMVFRNAPHETVCGDRGAVLEGRHGTLFIVADGLGHGPEAHLAATRATEIASANREVALEPLMQMLDRGLASTRGAAVSMMRIEHGEQHPTPQMAFVGVGNVECRARSRKPIQPLTLPGIVGRGVRRIRCFTFPVSVSDMFVLFTDGISSRMELDPTEDPEALSRAVLAQYARGTDDALALAIRVAA